MASNSLEIVPHTLPRVTLEPNTLAEAKEFAEIAAKSDLVPKDYKGNAFNVLIAIQFGKELGVQPMQALQGIAVINGRPAVWGDLQLAIVVAHPEFEDIEEDDPADIKAAGKATCIVHRRGRKPVKRTFSMEDAKTAKLAEKDGPWKTYPHRMLQMRARGFALRDAFPDALKGLVSIEEARDYDEAPALPPSSFGHPGPLSAPAAEQKPDLPITQEQAREFGKAWKAGGRTIEQAKAFLKDKLGVDSSLKILESKLAHAMEWAKGEPKPTAPAPEPSADEKICFELFKILGYDDVKQAAAIKEHASDWAKLATALNRELPAES